MQTQACEPAFAWHHDSGCKDSAARASRPWRLWAAQCGRGFEGASFLQVAGAQPGPLSWIDYGRADVWAVGALCYPLWGLPLPFGGGVLDSRSYREQDLPPLPKDVPPAVRALVRDMLHRDPQQVGPTSSCGGLRLQI